LIKAVAKEGYVVNYTIEPKHGVNGEFFVYKVDGEKKTVVFSNSEEHKDSATVDYSINKKNMDDIVKKITG